MTPAISPAGKPRRLPTHKDLPFEDRTVSHNFFDHDQCRLLTSSVDLWLGQKRPGFDYAIGEDSYIYWDITTPPTLGAKAPDWYFVPGVPHLLDGDFRNSYVLWNEKIVPTVAMEFVSVTPGGEWDQTPRTGKFWVYEQGICIPHYAILHPWQKSLDAFKLVGGKYQPARPNARGHYPIESLGLEYGLWHGYWARTMRPWVRFWDNQGELLQTPEEVSGQLQREAVEAQRQAGESQRQAEESQRQAEESQRQAEESQRQAQQFELEKRRAYDKLRELGIDPEKLA